MKASPTELTWFAENEWALTYSGRHQISSFLDSVRALTPSRAYSVWDILGSHLRFISDNIVTDAERPAFTTWAESTLKPVMDQIGWEPKSGDSLELKAMRSDVFRALGLVARDQHAFSMARDIVNHYMADESSVDPSLVEDAFVVAAFQGDAQLYDAFLNHMREAKSPGEHNRYMAALADFHDPALLERTLKLTLTDDVRSQDAARLIVNVMRNPAGRQLAWQFVKADWPQIKAKSSVWSAASIVFGASSFCDPQAASEVQQFFGSAQLPGAKRTLRQSVERISECSHFRQAQEPVLAKFLRSAGGEQQSLR
jgi:aminopeptidase N